MDDPIKKHASNYFSYFYNLTLKWKLLIENLDKPLSALKNLAEQLSHIEHAKIDEFSDFPDLREKLVFKVFVAIDEEMETMRLLQNEFAMAVNELRNKLNHFEKSTSTIDWDDLLKIKGTALYPSLSTLLQLSYQGWCIFNDLNQNLANAIKSIDVRTESTLKFNLNVNENHQTQLNEIIALTQYCYNS